MNKPNKPNVSIKIRQPDGSLHQIFPCRNLQDLENQKQFPAWVLALCTFSPIVQGRLNFSLFTRNVLKQLSDTYCDELLREVLRELLIDIEGGFRPHNPFGLFVARVRRASGGFDTIQL